MRRFLGGVPRTMWAITALHVALLSVYSLIFPTFRPPDEAEHVDMVLTIRATSAWPDYDEAFVSRRVAFARGLTGAVEFDRAGPRPASAATPRGHRPSFQALARAADPSTGARASRPVDSEEPNQIANHPPGYYALVGLISGAVDRLLPGELAYDQAVWVMRAVSLLFVAGLPVLAWAAARRLGARGPAVAVGAGLFPLAVPQLAHIGASVNNDTLLIGLFGVLTWLLAVVVGADRARAGGSSDRIASAGVALATGLVGAAALLVKGFALVAGPWIVGAYALAWWRTRDRRVVARGALAAGVAGLGGGWWYVRNLALFGAVQPAISTMDPPPATFESSLAAWWLEFRARIVRRYWGQFGYFDTVLPRAAFVWSTVVALAATALAGLASLRARLRPRPGDLAVMAYPTVALLALVGYGSWQAYVRTGLTPGVQGRYLFGGVVGLAVLVAVGLRVVLPGRARAWLPGAVLVWGAVMHGLALPRILTTYWGAGPAPSLASSLRGLAAGAPWPVGVTIAIGVATGLALLWTVYDLTRICSGEGVRSGEHPEGPCNRPLKPADDRSLGRPDDFAAT